MNLLFLGTGAAGLPDEMKADPLYRIGDPSFRRHTSTLLDGTVLFDCGPHALACLDHFGADVSAIRALFMTHFHGDHYNPAVIASLAERTSAPLEIYYHESADLPAIPHTVPHPIRYGEALDVLGYHVLPLRGNHTKSPCHYAVEKGEKRFFYGLDGAWIEYDTFYAIRDLHFDLIVLDATVGDDIGNYRVAEHNSIPMIRMMVPSFRTVGMVDDRTVIVLDHLAGALHKPHPEIVESVRADGFVVAYDGLKLTI